MTKVVSKSFVLCYTIDTTYITDRLWRIDSPDVLKGGDMFAQADSL
jgi:hypothetical protein